MSEILKKGGKKAGLGEIRVYSNQKWKKTVSGWEPVKDVHKAKSDGHQAHVHTITKDRVFYHVHDKEGGKVANGKMSHADFKHNYTPVIIYHPEGGSSDSDHVLNYTSVDPTVLSEEVIVEPIEETESEDETDEDLEDFIDSEGLDLDVDPVIEDLDELDTISIDPYKKRIIQPINSFIRSSSPEEGQIVRFISDGVKREGVITEVAPNKILTIRSGSRVFYIAPTRLLD